jgi:2,3-bisphosphoglycerate-independent phosphoglycerate mutase
LSVDKKPIALIILDGWGLNPREDGNAVVLGSTPIWDSLLKKYPNTVLKAAGRSVGLPEGQMGNSEVGHLNLGAGRIVYQPFTRVNNAIESGEFFENQVLNQSLETAVDNGSNLHLVGLLSDGGVHSHINHLFAILELAKKKGLENVYVHAILDGRDTPPKAAKKYIKLLQTKIQTDLGIGKIATVMGRYYAMDRDNRWDREKKAYDAIVFGEGLKSNSALDAVVESYKRGDGDEFVIPTVIKKHENLSEPVARLIDNDVVIMYNFRADRIRQLTHAIMDDDFDAFDRGKKIKVDCTCMMEYEANIDAPVLFPPLKIKNTLGEVLSKNNFKQLRIAETEKYAHVTFFFNGELETPYPGETRVLIPSPRIATYDLQPEMSAYKVKDTVIHEISECKFDVIILNFANGDMVGHTGILNAAVQAVETVDKCLGDVIEALKNVNGKALVTADHGNAEEMIYYDTGEPHTTHTINDVACILVTDEDLEIRQSTEDNALSLSDIAPTILELLGIKKPTEMTGESLIIK